MTGITLHGFNIAAVQLQFVSNAGMTQTVKYDIRQIVILDQFFETLADRSLTDRKPVVCCNDQIVFLIYWIPRSARR